MSVKDLKKRLDKCNAEHEQQVKYCTNEELETKGAMEKTEAAHGGALGFNCASGETR